MHGGENMRIKTDCMLVYVKEVETEDSEVERQETIRKVQCDVLQQFSAYYYKDFNRDMMRSLNISIFAHYFDLEVSLGQLRYILYKNKRYVIKKILKDKQKGWRYKLLDLEEQNDEPNRD